jgi:hypothetical protein
VTSLKKSFPRFLKIVFYEFSSKIIIIIPYEINGKCLGEKNQWGLGREGSRG